MEPPLYTMFIVDQSIIMYYMTRSVFAATQGIADRARS